MTSTALTISHDLSDFRPLASTEAYRQRFLRAFGPGTPAWVRRDRYDEWQAAARAEDD